jgi:hypothetical protein
LEDRLAIESTICSAFDSWTVVKVKICSLFWIRYSLLSSRSLFVASNWLTTSTSSWAYLRMASWRSFSAYYLM